MNSRISNPGVSFVEELSIICIGEGTVPVSLRFKNFSFKLTQRSETSVLPTLQAACEQTHVQQQNKPHFNSFTRGITQSFLRKCMNVLQRTPSEASTDFMDACNFSLDELCLVVPNKMNPQGGIQLPCLLALVQFE